MVDDELVEHVVVVEMKLVELDVVESELVMVVVVDS